MNEEDENREFKVAAFWHRIFGIRSEDDKSHERFNRVKVYIFGIVSIYVCIYQYTGLIVIKDPDNLPDYVIEAATTTLGMVKITSCVLIRDDILELIHLTKKTRELQNVGQRELKIYESWQNYQDIITKMCIKSYAVLVLHYICSPLITYKVLPFQGILPKIAYQKPWYYLVYIFQSICISMNLVGCITADTYLIAFMCQLCAKLELANLSMENLGRKGRNYIPQAIKKHSVALHYGGKVCDSLSPVFLMQHLMVSMLLCFAGVVLLEIKNKIVFMKTLLLLIVTIFSLFIICVVGEIVTNASLKIAKTIEEHTMEHFLEDPAALKSLSFILCRAQKPLRIGVGLTSSINLKLFTDTMNTLISAFMLLRKMIN